MANYRRTPPHLRVPHNWRVTMLDGSFWVVKAAYLRLAIRKAEKLARLAGLSGAAAQVVHAERTSWTW